MTPDLPERAVVLLGEEEVGVLLRTGEHSRFEPAEAWASLAAGDRPVLGQQFEEDPFAAHVGRQRLGVPLWFEHLLPEVGSPLRVAVARALDVSATRSYPLLLALGDDLPGNVRIRAVEGDLSFRTVARRVRESHGETGADEVLPLRVSLAGLQFKISVRLDKRGIAVPGWDEDGDWIVKFADQGHPELPAVEYATMSWAKRSGIDVPEIRLEETAAISGIESLANIAGERAFAIERYDRRGGARVHQEDFSQVLGLAAGDAKYRSTNFDTIFNVCAVLAPDDVDELISRITFCVLCGNDDAHAKNFSLWYPSATVPRLSPAYDLVPTLVFPQYHTNEMALKLRGVRAFEDVTISRMRSLGGSSGIDPDHIEDTVRRAVAAQRVAWLEVREASETPATLREFVDQRLERLPLVREALS